MTKTLNRVGTGSVFSRAIDPCLLDFAASLFTSQVN